MELLGIVAALALFEYIFIALQVGRARMRYNVPAPATTGDPIFERYYRVQQNTIEQLVVFLPALGLFGYFLSPVWAASLGIVFIVGRALYLRGYVEDPAKRGPGFLLTFAANLVLCVGGLVGAALAWVRG